MQKDFSEIVHENKHKSSKSNPEQIEQLCWEAIKWKVDLTEEIKILKGEIE